MYAQNERWYVHGEFFWGKPGVSKRSTRLTMEGSMPVGLRGVKEARRTMNERERREDEKVCPDNDGGKSKALE